MQNQSATATTQSRGESIRFIPVQAPLYPWLVAIFVTTFIISNLTASKGVQLGPLITDGAFFLFPLSYIIGDVLSECYGFKSTRRAVIIGFAMTILAAASYAIAIVLPAADFYDNQEAFASVLGTTPQILTAALAGYLVGQLLNALTLIRMKERQGEKGLASRLIVSTIVGELADTILFCSIAAPVIGIDSFGAFLNYVIVGFLWKTAMEVVLIPITTQVIKFVKAKENYSAAA